MSSSIDFPARGKVIRVEDSAVIFKPTNTNYEIKLTTAGKYDGAVNVVIDVSIVAAARKLWTISSGGNFVAPIFGPPRIVQGRIKYLDQTTMVVSAGVNVRVTLPSIETAFDLNAGALSVGSLVNVTLLPGAMLQSVLAPAAA